MAPLKLTVFEIPIAKTSIDALVESIRSLSEAEQKEVFKQLRVAGSPKTCVICMSQDPDCVFNCGHLVSCVVCSVKIKACPVCRKAIATREAVFM